MDFVVRLSDLEARIAECVSSTLEGEGYELVRVKAGTESGHSHMALYIDRLARDRAITMDDLEFLNGLLSDMLDVADTEKPFFKNSYNLEVSSPGVERPLSKRQHFDAAIGKTIRVKTDQLDKLPRSISGKLASVTEEGIQIETTFVPFVRLKDANEVFDFSTLVPQKPKGKEKKSKAEKPEGRK
jgi:ribosome maturation factor RimP